MIFISYRIADANDVVARLDDSLAAEFGREAVFRDKKRLKGSQDWPEEVRLHAISCESMLVVIGPSWKTAAYEDPDREGMLRLADEEDWVRREVSLALKHGRLVIPVLLNDVVLPSRVWLKKIGLEALYVKQGVRLRSDDYETDLEDLVKLVRASLPSTRAGEGAVARTTPAADASALERFYRQSLRAEHDRPQGIFASEIPSLSRVFVDLDVERERDSEQRAERLKGRACTLGDLLSGGPDFGPQPRWVLLGDPGSGKSTLARHLVFDLASDPSRPLPVYASLPTLAAEQCHPFDLAEERLAAGRRKGSSAGLSDLLAERADKGTGRVWLLLDGLDEVSAAHRRWVVQQLAQWAESLPGVPIAVLSRSVGYEQPGAAYASEARILPLDVARERDLLQRWLGRELAELALAHLQSRVALRELCQVPLQLSLYALLVRESERLGDPERQLPTRRVELYARAIETLLARGHGDEASSGVEDPEGAWEVLSELSLSLQDSSEESWSRFDLIGRLNALCGTDGSSVREWVGSERTWGTSAAFLKDVSERSGVLSNPESSRSRSHARRASWRFLHRQLREVLAASCLRKEGDRSVVSRTRRLHPDEIPGWAEVLGFACEMAADPLSVLRSLAEVDNELALRVLPEVEGVDHVEALGILRGTKEGWDGDFLVVLLNRWLDQKSLGMEDAVGWLWRQVRPGRSTQELAYLFYGLEHLCGTVDAERFFRACDRVRPAAHPEPRWVHIAGGRFTMGSPSHEDGGALDEGPHDVRLSPYWMAATAVTNGEYKQFDPKHEATRFERSPRGEIPLSELPHHPVVDVTWWGAYLYSRWVSGSLPTEAQWEHACRAGTRARFSFEWPLAPDEVNCAGFLGRTVSVDSLLPNRWGLHGMHGNVMEWCADGYRERLEGPIEDPLMSAVGSLRVVRGGSWLSPASDCRSAARGRREPGDRDNGLGFRVCLLPGPGPSRWTGEKR